MDAFALCTNLSTVFCKWKENLIKICGIFWNHFAWSLWKFCISIKISRAINKENWITGDGESFKSSFFLLFSCATVSQFLTAAVKRRAEKWTFLFYCRLHFFCYVTCGLKSAGTIGRVEVFHRQNWFSHLVRWRELEAKNRCALDSMSFIRGLKEKAPQLGCFTLQSQLCCQLHRNLLRTFWWQTSTAFKIDCFITTKKMIR